MGQQTSELAEMVRDTLRSGGVDSVSLEASLIISETAGKSSRHTLALAEKRASGIPLAYLLGVREFMSLDIILNEHVMIPRPETEILVETTERYAAALKRPVTYIDVGTGSGNISVALLVRDPGATAVCVDISPGALTVARENAGNHKVLERCRLVCGDLLTAIRGTFRADIIVSNPPYIASSEFESLPREVRDHEPRIALYGGSDGLDIFRRLAETATEHLVDGGFLAVEVGFGQADSVKGVLSSSRMDIVEIVKDLFGIDRVVIARKN